LNTRALLRLEHFFLSTFEKIKHENPETLIPPKSSSKVKWPTYHKAHSTSRLSMPLELRPIEILEVPLLCYEECASLRFSILSKWYPLYQSYIDIYTNITFIFLHSVRCVFSTIDHGGKQNVALVLSSLLCTTFDM
jgi:hypothetical protein